MKLKLVRISTLQSGDFVLWTDKLSDEFPEFIKVTGELTEYGDVVTVDRKGNQFDLPGPTNTVAAKNPERFVDCQVIKLEDGE